MGSGMGRKLKFGEESAFVSVRVPKSKVGEYREAMKWCVADKLARIPVVSLFDTDDILDGIDLAIPANNRGKKALGLAFWFLARQILLELGKISSEDDFPYTLEEFTSKIVPVYRQENAPPSRQSTSRQSTSRQS
ncbi:unnamed protein product, partial [marine sediment metagenome]